jgi:hypothetical protein
MATSTDLPHQLPGRAALIYGTLALSPSLGVVIVAAIAAGAAFGPVNPIFATVT